MNSRTFAPIAAVLFICLGLVGASAQQRAAPPRAEIEAIVRDYIRTHPEIIEEALTTLDKRRAAERRVRMESDARDFALGPRNAPVTIVEFFDYRCPYCHTAMGWVLEAARRNPRKVRVVFKEFPILGPMSVEASQAAIAAGRQGKYMPFHRALMGFRGQLTSRQIDTLARSAGVDVVRMRRDMGQTDILTHLEANHAIAQEAAISGTPAFLINGEMVEGGWNEESANRALNAALRAAR